MNSILICDDDKDIVNALKIYLNNPDYKLFTAYSGKDALKIESENDLDLILLDIMMPGIDGIEVLSKIRERSNVPVILITAKSEDTDKILGLNVGADDYITKPFNPMELVARVSSIIRRYTKLGASKIESGPLVVGGIELSDKEKTIKIDGEERSFTPTEYDILKLLMENPGTVFSPREIYKRVWKEDPRFSSDNTVAVHVRHIREKIEITPNEPRYIKVIFGQGYKIDKGRL